MCARIALPVAGGREHVPRRKIHLLGKVQFGRIVLDRLNSHPVSRLREAKGLSRAAARSFAALRMTGRDLAGGEELSLAFEPCLNKLIGTLEHPATPDKSSGAAIMHRTFCERRRGEGKGVGGEGWRAGGVGGVVRGPFGVGYHRDHVGKLIREAGWSRQKPVERASQRDEEAIKQWYEERWPQIKKKPTRRKLPSSG